LRRLGIPLIPLLLAWLVISVVSVVAGAENTTVQLASQMALIPTWFLAAYLMVIMVAPSCLILWERFGWLSILGGLALSAAEREFSVVVGQPQLGSPDYLLEAAPRLPYGYDWLEGGPADAEGRLLLAAIALEGLSLHVTLAPYPVLMHTSADAEFSN